MRRWIVTGAGFGAIPVGIFAFVLSWLSNFCGYGYAYTDRAIIS